MGSDHALNRGLLTLALVLTALWLAVTPGLASAGPVTLQRALEMVRRHNPELSAVRHELTVAKGVLQKASYLSQSNFQTASEGSYRQRSGQSNSQDWRVAFIQEFEVFGQRALRQKSARQGFEVSSAEVRDQTRLLEGAVKLSFYDSLRARDNAVLLSELAKLDFKLLDAARSRLDAGEINQIEYNSAQIRYGQSHRALLQAVELYRLQRSSLGRLLGGQAGPEPEPAGDTRVQPRAFQIENLLAAAQKGRPDLRARHLEIARLDTESALNDRLNWPNPAFGMLIGHENNTEHFGGPMLGFSMPLFNRRVGEATILAARRAQAKDSLRAAELDIEKQVRDAYYGYLTAIKTLRLYQDDVVVPARESFGLLEGAFTEGKINLLRLAIAEREAFEARTAYVNAWFDVLAAQVAIELATGSPIEAVSK